MLFAGSHPDMCLGVVVGGAGTDMPNSKFGITMMGVLYKLLSKKTLASLVRSTYKHPPLSAQVSEDIIKEAFMRSGCYYECWDEINELMTGQDYCSLLTNYGERPILFINGELDFRAAEQKWLGCTKQGRLEIIQGGTHFCPLDDRHYAHFNKVLIDFADSLDWVSAGWTDAGDSTHTTTM